MRYLFEISKEHISLPKSEFTYRKSFFKDCIINFLGFIPFGFILSATLIKFEGTFEKHYILIAVLFCFAVSLIIEVFQAWIPSRSSSMLDLILNTLGALIGARILGFLSYKSLVKEKTEGQ